MIWKASAAARYGAAMARAGGHAAQVSPRRPPGVQIKLLERLLLENPEPSPHANRPRARSVLEPAAPPRAGPTASGCLSAWRCNRRSLQPGQPGDLHAWR